MLEDIKKVIVPILVEKSTELVDIAYRREAGRMVLRLLVDKEGGIKLDDCVMLNEKIGDILDRENVITESYTIEVDSPGIDRWFTSKRDYEKAKGRPVRITLNEAVLNKKEYIGRLKEVLGDSIKVNIKKKGIIEIPFDKITRARQEIELGIRDKG